MKIYNLTFSMEFCYKKIKHMYLHIIKNKLCLIIIDFIRLENEIKNIFN